VLYERARVSESIEFRFRAGSIELLPGQESQLQRAVAEMKELLRMAEGDKSGMNITIEVHAHTDTIGTELYNLKLRESRAKVMSHWLANSGVDMRRLRPVAPLQFEQERIDRAASFRVVITAGLNGLQGSR
jgi:outer membrane protein OmpA-like peptidoglycan-associated protein